MPLPEPGSVLDERYELYRILGAGGFGVVFAATDQNTEEPVAIKMMLAHLLAEDVPTRRFEREMRIARRVRHPNIVQLRDFGVTEDNLLYYAMELLEGTDLAAHIAERGPLRPGAAVHVFEQVLAALGEAHQMGIVHRDIKPENLFICPTEQDRWFTKVLDFGIAKSVMAGDHESITRTGQILGTPQYMAPETIAHAELTPASDVYAVGLSLFEALTGQPLFSGTPYDVLVQQMRDHKPMPEGLAGSPLGAFIEKCLRKDPTARFPNASSALRSLREVVPSAESMPAIAAPVVIRAPDKSEGHQVALSMEDRRRLTEAAAAGSATEAPVRPIELQTFAALDDEGWDRLHGSGRPEERDVARLAAPVLGVAVFVIGLAGVSALLNLDTNLGSVGFDGASAPRDFTIRIDSEPSGGRLWVDDQFLGTTPRVVTIDDSELPVAVTVGTESGSRKQVLTEPRDQLVLQLPAGAKPSLAAGDVPIDVESDDSFDLDDIDYEEKKINPQNVDAWMETLRNANSSGSGRSPRSTTIGRRCGQFVQGDSEKVEVVVSTDAHFRNRVETALVEPRPDADALLNCVQKRFASFRPTQTFHTVVEVERRRHSRHQEAKKDFREKKLDEDKAGPVIEYAQ